MRLTQKLGKRGRFAKVSNSLFKRFRAEVAQSVEQGTENPRVGSSILSLGTNNIKDLQI